jgi:uncharacterized protein with HEPN domain
VERELTIVGEAVAALARVSPQDFAQITHARRIVDFRNQLTQEYPAVDNAVVWLIAECSALLSEAHEDSRRLSETPACLTP